LALQRFDALNQLYVIGTRVAIHILCRSPIDFCHETIRNKKEKTLHLQTDETPLFPD
jgi:hypothetical protein